VATDRGIDIEYTLKSFGPRYALMTINKRRLIILTEVPPETNGMFLGNFP
jgi:hypothetical protein